MMIRASVCFLAAALLAGGLLSSRLARGEETLVWTANTNGDLISLTYGSLDTSKPPVLLLSCFNEMNIGVLEIFGTIEGTRPGQKVSIDLSAGGTQSSIDGSVELDDKTGMMFAEASDLEIAPVIGVLKAPGPLTVKTAATTRTLPEVGRAEAADRFSKDCQIG
ncbi:MAG TPA: hypothetical protein VHK26_13190 [Methyloceanibacter sp.]|jgi:hypothetical protein|nr:hypothetical protein [Methyloceanibacter sp.]